MAILLKTIFPLLLSTTLFTTASAAPSSLDALTNQLKKVLPDAEAKQIAETPIKGLYQITTDSQVVYMNDNGDYMLYGHLLDIRTDTPASLTENALKGVHLNTLRSLDPKSTILFSPKNPKYTLTVFTDIDCGYCRKLHQEVPALNKANIAVRYVAFPRAGIDSDSFNKAVNVWCAPNQQQAMTDAKMGKEVPKTPHCNQREVIKRHLKLVEKMELRATPVIFLEDGSQIPGYMPADAIIQKISS